MFAIELVAVHGRREPEVLRKMTSSVARLVDADKAAKSLFEKMRREQHTVPPDGYQIRAHDGNISLRWW